MPIKIKIFLTIYLLVIGFSVFLFENYLGKHLSTYIVAILTFLMIVGIWIFPEVVTKKTK